MATMDDQNNAPESWEQELNGASGEGDQLSKELSSLNVNAPAFTPGINVHAQEFVPAFLKSPTEVPSSTDPPDPMAEPANAMEVDSQKIGNKDSPDEAGSSREESPVADWDENVDDENEEETMNTDSAPKEAAVKPKRKAVKEVKSTVKKEHVNIIFIGHVDAGKSTIGGHIMYLTGQVDKRTLEKYEKEAKEINRETWYLSWALDTNLEERDKGKTVEVGRAAFETDVKHFTILDAPGHKGFVPNMIGGASQADVAILVISARRGEFETGFERGGQTREHAMLVKTAGVRHLVVLINKMDDPTVEWSEERYNECKEKIVPYLKKCGFNPKSDIYFLPVSGLTGANLKELISEDVCPWYRGPSLIDYLDTLPIMSRAADGPLRIPVVDRYKDMGVILLGKVESGVLQRNMALLMMPNKVPVKVMQLWSNDDDSDIANPGENVKIKITGVEEEDVSPGFVLCPYDNLCSVGKVFDAQIMIIELKSIICAGYSAILHLHTCAEEVTIKAFLCLLDKKTGEKTQMFPRFVKQDQVVIARIEVNGGMICIETFKDFPQMGRFTLRDEGKSIAIGKVLKIVE